MKTIAWISILFASFTYTAGAQMRVQVINTGGEEIKTDSIDTVLFTAQYEMTFTPDSLNPEKKESEIMLLKIGKKSSAFYSYAQFLSDSAFEAEKAAKGSMGPIRIQRRQHNTRVTASYYKNYPEGKTSTLDEVGMSKFVCEEKTELPEWAIHDDTLTVLGYSCQMATCRFKGRDYEAWFTTEIPRGEGPWKLQGLPGMILKAKDTRDHYSFECTGIEQQHGQPVLTIQSRGRQPVSRKELNKLYERFMADPVGYITSASPNVSITVKDESGKSSQGPKNMPYNPIELSLK